MKNERIVIFITSVVILIQITLFTVASMVNNIWSINNSNELSGQIIIAIVINIVSSGLIYFAFSKAYRCYWKKKKYPHLDAEDLWYSIKTDPNKKNHLRIGTAKIEQEYFNIHINSDAHNVIYYRDENSLREDMNAQTTFWEENCILSENGVLKGVFMANCSDGSTRNGFHFYVLQKCQNTKPNIIDGWFVDIADMSDQFDIANPRKGKIILFRNKDERDKYAKEICDAHVDADGRYQTPSRNVDDKPIVDQESDNK